MYLKKRIYSTIFPLFIMVAIFSLFVCVGQRFIPKVFASAANGTIDGTNKYAWSENLGWINFGTSQGNVSVTDGQLTGYAWSENAGWISLNCSNDNSCGTVNYKVSNDGKGVLSGYAWGENVGWINFNPVYGRVTINVSTGKFSGYAWGENVGWIVFDCTTSACVKTDWRSRSVRSHDVSLWILQKIDGPISTSTLMVPPEIVKSSTFTKNLRLGNTDISVKALQQYLNASGFTVAKQGPGSPGNETNKFGALTKAALIKFQEAHAKEILAPLGLTRGTGIFGPATRSYLNSLENIP